MSVTDDEIIRKRLLIDGDGGTDDKRINNLLKMFIKWCNAPGGDEESEQTYQRMLSTLAQCEFTMEKSMLVHEMNCEEQINYEELNKLIDTQIKEAHKKIAECKHDLQEAKRIRRNRQDYDNLARVIQQEPDRLDTMRKLSDLAGELSELKSSKENLDGKLEMRRKQFHVLVSAIHEMQRILEDDERREDAMEAT